jgi:hypothetical protein
MLSAPPIGLAYVAPPPATPDMSAIVDLAPPSGGRWS